MNAKTQSSALPRDLILATAKELGLSMEAAFIPWSRSRNKGEKHPSLNWSITIWRDTPTVPDRKRQPIITTDYGAGSGHCPSYKVSIKPLGGRNSVMRDSAIRWGCENGKAAVVMEGINHISGTGGPLQPDFCDVLHSLVLDAGAIDARDFADWASEYGYDTDSRKAEATYRACLDIGLKLRAAIGDAGLAKLREACQDY